MASACPSRALCCRAMVSEEKRDWLTLACVRGLGPALIGRLLRHFNSPAAILAASEQALGEVPGIGRKIIAQIKDAKILAEARAHAEKQLVALSRNGIELLCLGDPGYPHLLQTIYDPPAMLYCRGDRTCLSAPTVAIVGSRAATAYGKKISFELARDLAAKGVTVVSGMALGIDREAHLGALAASGRTAGVLGCGIDVVYPEQNRRLFAEVSGRGLLVSEYPPGTMPEGYRFPARNRIISGLVQGVIVVEATLKSGSLITARQALEQGREVFAVPGRVDSAKSRGTHQLLQQGAYLAQSADSVLEDLGLAFGSGNAMQNETGPLPAEVSVEERHLLDFLDVYPLSIDEIVGKSGLSVGRVHELLLGLELKGLVSQSPGQQYELNGTR